MRELLGHPPNAILFNQLSLISFVCAVVLKMNVRNNYCPISPLFFALDFNARHSSVSRGTVAETLHTASHSTEFPIYGFLEACRIQILSFRVLTSITRFEELFNDARRAGEVKRIAYRVPARRTSVEQKTQTRSD